MYNHSRIYKQIVA